MGRDSAPVPVSSGGGHEPLWARDRSQLFYQKGEAMMAAKVLRTEPTFLAGEPRSSSERASSPGISRHGTYDVAPDGRFLMIQQGDAGAELPRPDKIIFVLNWFEELKRLVPMND